MSTGLRIRSTCQSCQTRGQFRPLESMYHKRGAWEWRLHVLCAVCRLHLEQLLDGRRSNAAPARPGAAPPARSPIGWTWS
jgi:hypothetical protein